ncbi:MAG: hypothetical protein M9962_04090 [Oligoflexia bacterium]|nr:hypothetical protein [Oligoflexia bacterium]
MDKDFRTGMSELTIVPNRSSMAARGVSIESVGQILAAAVGGITQGRYTSDGRRYDVRFKTKRRQH